MTDTAGLVQQARDPEAPPGARREAFCALVRRYQDAAFGYAYALLGDPHQAQDATQEALLDAYRRLEALRVPEAFPGWLRRIVRTHCLRLRRAKEPLPSPSTTPSRCPGGPIRSPPRRPARRGRSSPPPSTPSRPTSAR